MRIDPGAISGALNNTAGASRPIQADPAATPQRIAVVKKKQAAALDAAELGKAALNPAKPVDLGRTPAAVKAQLRQAAAQSSAPPAHSLDGPRPAAEPPTPPADSRMASFLASYGASKGDSRFNEKFDLDGDGVIGFSDLNALLSQPAEPAAEQRVFTSGDLDGLLKSFNSRLGDDGFNPEYDLNQDGVIDFTDLNNLVNNLSPDAVSESPVATEVTGLLGAFNRREGQEGFDARFDYDNDGVVSFADLNQLLDQLTGA